MTAPAKAAPMREDVTQADRIEAALLFDRTSWPSWNSATDQHSQAAQHMLDGKGDGSPYVQAFARHRLAHTARPDAGDSKGKGAATFEALERFITDHEGNDETNDGMDVDRLAREAVSNLRAVVSASLAVCHSGEDDCTNGRTVTIDPDAFDTLNAALNTIDADNIPARPDAGDEDVERVARALGNEMLERNGGELDLDQLEWRGCYGGNWIPFDLKALALAAMREGVDRGMVERAKAALMWAIAEIDGRTIYRDNAVCSAADQRKNALQNARDALAALDTEQPR